MTTTKSLKDRLFNAVGIQVSELQERYRKDDSSAVANLARLRRGVGKSPGEHFDLIGLTIEGLYPDAKGLPDEPTEAENAAFAALTLFALHQQSHRNASMHRSQYSFGRSARLLGRHTNSQDAVRARFTALATAQSWDGTVRYAMSFIQQFRAQAIPLDYAQFAVDLYRLQFPDSADRVRLRWGRDFYRQHHPEDDAENNDTSADTDA